MPKKRIGIFIIAYQAVRTLITAYERIPQSIKDAAEEIYVIDDCSNDNTYFAGLGYKHEYNIDKLKIFRNQTNLRYGGNQKKGYEYAIERGLDIVVMLHGDVQYAPEKIPDLIAPLINDEADLVMGSRMLEAPLRGGMPIWKYCGNRFLTWMQNKALKTNLSEFHSGFRAYNVHALKQLPFKELTDEFHFDTEIVIQFLEKGLRIKEIPMPTHYGPESHQVGFRESVRYGFNILKTLFEYKVHKVPSLTLKTKKYDV
ncbi:MAG: glycosyltransferase family 2 protein [Candidatus Omnitrophica bacterium]|nr:glycosyltransferase family 2 protein [Candidatus Omnitrophota bacterium]